MCSTILLLVHMDLGQKLLSQRLPDRFLNKIYDPKLIYIKFNFNAWQSMTNLRWDVLGGLNPDCGIPFSGRKDSHLIKELVYPREEICSVFCLVRHIMKYLEMKVFELSVCCYDMYLFTIRSKFHLMFNYRTCILIKVHYLMEYVKIGPDTCCILYLSFFAVTRKKNTYSPTSSVISVAMDLPISWYWGPLP